MVDVYTQKRIQLVTTVLWIVAVFAVLFFPVSEGRAQDKKPVEVDEPLVVKPPVLPPVEPKTSANQNAASALPAVEGQEGRSPEMELNVSGGQVAPPGGMEAVLSPEERERRIRKEAYEAALRGLMPLKPEEIRTMLEKFDETDQATAIPVYPYPEPEVTVETVSLDPGAMPPVLKLGMGHVTTLAVLDSTGAPWPIHDISWGGNFEVVQPEEGANVLRISPTSEFAYGNMSMRLVHLRTPVTFTMKTTRGKIHYRFDARIPEFGPNADVPLVRGKLDIAAGDTVLGTILEGVPPQGAQRLLVSGTDGRTTAFRVDTTTYVRTPLKLLSPNWSKSVASADGMSVYALSNAPVILLSDHGQMVRAQLSERKALEDE